MDNRKIGDYIHLHYDNYLKYGINKDGTSSKDVTFSFSEYKNKAAKAHLKKFKTNNDDLQEISKMVNLILSPDSKYDNKNQEEVIKKIRSVLEEQFKDIDIDWKKATQANDEAVIADAVDSIKRIKKISTDNTNEKRVQLNTLLKRVNSLIQIRDTIVDANTKDELKKAINEIKKELEKIGNINSKISGDNNGTLLELSTNKNKLLNIADNKSLIDKINEALDTFILKPANLNLRRGDFFEYVIAVAPLVARNEAMQVSTEMIENMIKESVVGTSSRYKIEFDKKYFSDMVNFEELNFQNYNNSDGILTSYLTSQGKIDVELQWTGNNNYHISAKNINFKNKIADIHLVSGSSMLYMIQNSDPIFVNHYLNITSTHNTEKDLYSPNLSYIKLAHETMKLELFIKALTGNLHGRPAANIFIVNDRSKKGRNGVKVIDMEDIINKIFSLSNIFSDNKNIAVKTKETDLSNIVFKNHIAGDKKNLNDNDAETRLLRLLTDIHAKKINVSISKNFINNNF